MIIERGGFLKKLIFPLFVISILLGGCFVKKDDYDAETVEKAVVATENYLKEKYNDIETIEIEKVYRSPMGGMTVDGTVNNKYEFSIGVEESDFSIGSMVETDGFPERKK